MMLTPEALHALKWIRDNNHHIGEWLPKNAKPHQSTHMKLSSYTDSIKVKSEHWVELRDFICYDKPDTLFYPNDDGLAVINEMELTT